MKSFGPHVVLSNHSHKSSSFVKATVSLVQIVSNNEGSTGAYKTCFGKQSVNYFAIDKDSGPISYTKPNKTNVIPLTVC